MMLLITCGLDLTLLSTILRRYIYSLYIAMSAFAGSFGDNDFFEVIWVNLVLVFLLFIQIGTIINAGQCCRSCFYDHVRPHQRCALSIHLGCGMRESYKIIAVNIESSSSSHVMPSIAQNSLCRPGTVTMLMVKFDERSKALRDKKTNLKAFKKMHDVPDVLYNAMAEHLELHFNNEQTADENVLAVYPATLRRKVGGLRRALEPQCSHPRILLSPPGPSRSLLGQPANLLPLWHLQGQVSGRRIGCCPRGALHAPRK